MHRLLGFHSWTYLHTHLNCQPCTGYPTLLPCLLQVLYLNIQKHVSAMAAHRWQTDRQLWTHSIMILLYLPACCPQELEGRVWTWLELIQLSSMTWISTHRLTVKLKIDVIASAKRNLLLYTGTSSQTSLINFPHFYFMVKNQGIIKIVLVAIKEENKRRKGKQKHGSWFRNLNIIS